jgi:hypothetical protein
MPITLLGRKRSTHHTRTCYISASFHCIALDASGKHQIAVALYEDLQVQQIAQDRVVQHKDAFDDDDVSAIQVLRLGQPLVLYEGVNGDFGGFEALEISDAFDHLGVVCKVLA